MTPKQGLRISRILQFMKYLGIDYGTKRVGIALSDERGSIAFPHSVLQNDDSLLPALAMLIEREQVMKIAIGDTRASGGAENVITPNVEAFAIALRKRGVSVTLVPELLSSFEAGRYVRASGQSDASAAAIILQRYLDGLRTKT